jgi:hypothetical protein
MGKFKAKSSGIGGIGDMAHSFTLSEIFCAKMANYYDAGTKFG